MHRHTRHQPPLPLPTSPEQPPRAASRFLPWALVAAAFAFDVAAWYPGALPFDNAFLWWQVRGGESNDVGSPALLWVWRGTEAFASGPGPVLVLHLLLFWSGLGLLLGALRAGPAAATAIVVAIAAAPVVLVMRGAVLTDMGLMSSLLFSTGAIARAAAGAGRAWLLPAVPALFYGLALRHNALPAILPLVVAAAAVGLPPRHRHARGVTAATLLSLAALVGASALLARNVDRRVPVWPSVAQFDLAAISISSGTLLLPPFSVGPALTVGELAGAFRPWSNVPMLQGTKSGMADPLWTRWSAEQLSQWRRAWVAAILDHPADYLAHRVRLSGALFGTHERSWPRELAYFDGQVQYRDNPPIEPAKGVLHRGLVALAESSRATPVLAAWPYLLIGVLAFPFALAARGALPARLALMLLASAGLYAAPLVFLAPSAELRYLAWPCLACLLAAALAALASARDRLAR